MDAFDALMTRRSIRKFTSKPVPEDKLTEMLRAAMTAPSAGNQQPWHFVVITKRELLDKIPSIHPHAAMAKEAQAGILVCGDPKLEKHQGYWVQDCAAATENLLLAIHALGLAGVWTGVHPRPDREVGFRALLNIPDHVIPFAFLPIGYPAEEKPRQDRFNPDRVHKNGW